MANWWQSQLNFAEGLLDQVDKKVSTAVGHSESHSKCTTSAREVNTIPQSLSQHAPSDQGAPRSTPIPKSPARTRASPGSVKLPAKKTRPASGSNSGSSPDIHVTELPQEAQDPAHLATESTEALQTCDGPHARSPGSIATRTDPTHATPKSSPSTPVADSLSDAGHSGWTAAPRSPMAITHTPPAHLQNSSQAKQATATPRFPAVPPPPPPILQGESAIPGSDHLPQAAPAAAQSPLATEAGTPAPAFSSTTEPAQWPPQDREAVDATHDAPGQGSPGASGGREVFHGWGAAARAEDAPGPSAGSSPPAPADAILRASWWSSAQQPSDPPQPDAAGGGDSAALAGPAAAEASAASLYSGGSNGDSNGGISSAANGGGGSAVAVSNGAEAGGVLASGTTTADASAELPDAPSHAAAAPAASAVDSYALRQLREELTAAQGRAAVAESALAEARDNVDAAESRAAAAEARADKAAASAAEAASALADAQERGKAAVESAAAARSKAREAMERAGLKADQLRSCEARLGELEGEVEAATAAQKAAEAQVVRLQVEASRVAEAAAQEGHEYVDTLQRELTAAREAAEAAERTAAAERAAAGEARAAAARRQEQLEASLGSAHAEAANCARAAEEAAEALEVAEGRVVALEQRLAAAESGKSAFAAAESDRVAELQAALEAAEARCTAAQRAATDSKNQIEALEREALERSTSGAHIAIQELQQQLNQANHLLVERQAQWEHSGTERAARILTLERQLAHAEERASAAQRQAAAESGARGHSLMMADEVVPMASLGGYYRIASNRRFGGAVKAFGGTVDRATAQVVALLRRHPAARLVVLLYIASVHLFIYLLLGRMQHTHLQAAAGIPNHTPSLRSLNGSH
eukprot:jgi/Ulvmu1/7765/UM039_0074.1